MTNPELNLRMEVVDDNIVVTLRRGFIGCIECNRWSWPGSKRLFMEMPEEEFPRR